MRAGYMQDGYWDEESRRFIPPSHPMTVAVRRSVVACKYWFPYDDELRLQCAYCLDRTLSEDR